MVRTVLLVNSDLAVNRGDRAIAEGNIQLVRTHFPGARVVGLSQHPERDSAWYGIDFLDMDFQSLSPVDLVRLLRAARRADVVLWGGGELLKDYTNKAALWYWTLKMTLVSLVTPRLYGAYQGIGPTSSPVSRRLIASLVNRCRGFVVRDEESRAKVVAWGADSSRVVAASDPAVLPSPDPVDAELAAKLAADFDVDAEFLDDFICLGPRDWFHYTPGGLLPFKYAQRIPLLRRTASPEQTARHEAYLAHLTQLVSELTHRFDTGVLLAPMHLSESDTELCRLLRSHAADPSRVRILDRDTLSPREFRATIARARAMIGFRLHSNIIGISAAVPCVNVFYVDKGRVFFDQIGQSRFALPIERALGDDFVPAVLALFGELLEQRDAVRAEISAATDRLRALVDDAFTRVLVDASSPGRTDG